MNKNLINIQMNETGAIRTSDFRKETMRECHALKLNELSTEAFSKKPFDNRQRQGTSQMRQPVQPTPPVRQAPPPVRSTPPVRQVPPPVQPTPPVRQASPPVRSTPPVRQAPPPTQPTPPVRQAPPPTQPTPPARQAPPSVQPTPPRRPPLPPAQKLLRKGEKYSLTKNVPSATKLRIGIGWGFSGSTVYDVDIEAFMLDETEKVPDDSWIVFYGQLRSPDNSVIHRGDSSNGTNFGADCEQIDIDLQNINSRITKIAFVVTINEAKKYGYNFSGMKDAYIRITDLKTNKEIVRYELTDYYKEVVSMVVGELYLRNGEWRFNPVGMGTADDLEGLCNKYGIEVI